MARRGQGDPARRAGEQRSVELVFELAKRRRDIPFEFVETWPIATSMFDRLTVPEKLKIAESTLQAPPDPTTQAPAREVP